MTVKRKSIVKNKKINAKYGFYIYNTSVMRGETEKEEQSYRIIKAKELSTAHLLFNRRRGFFAASIEELQFFITRWFS